MGITESGTLGAKGFIAISEAAAVGKAFKWTGPKSLDVGKAVAAEDLGSLAEIVIDSTGPRLLRLWFSLMPSA